jgi:thiol-disulfide isomerase/thioredoxin
MLKEVYVFKQEGCGPCIRLNPIILHLADMYPNVNTYIIDINNRQDLASQFNVDSTPTTIFANGNTILQRIEGANKDKISQMYNYLSNM